MVLVDAVQEILWRPTLLGVIFAEMWEFMGPVWIAFVLGIMVGWAWKPRWASSPPSAISLIPSPATNQCVRSNQSLHHPRLQVRTAPDPGSGNMQINIVEEPLTLLSNNNPDCSSSENHVPRHEDLKHLWHLVRLKDAGPPWKPMMERSAPGLHYQAWLRDPQTGPTQYRMKTVYENATPQLMRDFFWDDEFRMKWDDMLLHAATLEEFPTTGASVVHWIRKFPFFCSDREYTISRRIWELGTSYYCVTKGVHCSSIPRKKKPRRVDLYYSSWFIQPVESKDGSEQPACEVTFFHHEDMGIPWEMAKLGVRQGMWVTARNVERGFRAYQMERAFSKTISLHVVMAQASTKIDENQLAALESDEDQKVDMAETQMVVRQEMQAAGKKVPKVLVLGGAVMVACSIDRGLLTKAIIFAVAKRFVSIGRQVRSRRSD